MPTQRRSFSARRRRPNSEWEGILDLRSSELGAWDSSPFPPGPEVFRKPPVAARGEPAFDFSDNAAVQNAILQHEWDLPRDKIRQSMIELYERQTDDDPLLHGPDRIKPGTLLPGGVNEAQGTDDVMRRLIDDLLVGAPDIIDNGMQKRLVDWWAKVVYEIGVMLDEQRVADLMERDGDRRLLDHYRSLEKRLHEVPRLEQELRQCCEDKKRLQRLLDECCAAKKDLEARHDEQRASIRALGALCEKLQVESGEKPRRANENASWQERMERFGDEMGKFMAYKATIDERTRAMIAVFKWAHDAVLKGQLVDLLAICENELRDRDDFTRAVVAAFREGGECKNKEWFRTGVVPDERMTVFWYDEARAWYDLLADMWQMHLMIQQLLLDAIVSADERAALPGDGAGAGAFSPASGRGGPRTGAFMNSLNHSALSNYKTDANALRSKDAYSKLLADRRRRLQQDNADDAAYHDKLRKAMAAAEGDREKDGKVDSGAEDVIDQFLRGGDAAGGGGGGGPVLDEETTTGDKFNEAIGDATEEDRQKLLARLLAAEKKRRNEFDNGYNQMWEEEMTRRLDFDAQWDGKTQTHFEEDTRRLEFERLMAGKMKEEEMRRKRFDDELHQRKLAGEKERSARLRRKQAEDAGGANIDDEERKRRNDFDADTDRMWGEEEERRKKFDDRWRAGPGAEGNTTEQHLAEMQRRLTFDEEMQTRLDYEQARRQEYEKAANAQDRAEYLSSRDGEMKRRKMFDDEEALRWQEEQAQRVHFDTVGWDGKMQTHFREDTRRFEWDKDAKGRHDDEMARRKAFDEAERSQEKAEREKRFQDEWDKKMGVNPPAGGRDSAAENAGAGSEDAGRASWAPPAGKPGLRPREQMNQDWFPDGQGIQTQGRSGQGLFADRDAYLAEEERLRRNDFPDEAMFLRLEKVESQLDELGLTSAELDDPSRTASNTAGRRRGLEEDESLLLAELERRGFDPDQAVLDYRHRTADELRVHARLQEQAERGAMQALSELESSMDTLENQKLKTRLRQKIYVLERMRIAVTRQLEQRLEPVEDLDLQVADEDPRYDAHRNQLLADWHRLRRVLGRVYFVANRGDRPGKTTGSLVMRQAHGQSGGAWVRAHAGLFLGLLADVCEALAGMKAAASGGGTDDAFSGNARVSLEFQKRAVVGLGFFHPGEAELRRQIALHAADGDPGSCEKIPCLHVVDRLRRYGAQELALRTAVKPTAAGTNRVVGEDSWLLRVPGERIAIQLASSKREVTQCLQKGVMLPYFDAMVTRKEARRFGVDHPRLPVVYFVVKVTLPFAFGTAEREDSKCEFYALVSSYLDDFLSSKSSPLGGVYAGPDMDMEGSGASGSEAAVVGPRASAARAPPTSLQHRTSKPPGDGDAVALPPQLAQPLRMCYYTRLNTADDVLIEKVFWNNPEDFLQPVFFKCHQAADVERAGGRLKGQFKHAEFSFDKPRSPGGGGGGDNVAHLNRRYVLQSCLSYHHAALKRLRAAVSQDNSGNWVLVEVMRLQKNSRARSYYSAHGRLRIELVSERHMDALTQSHFLPGLSEYVAQCGGQTLLSVILFAGRLVIRDEESGKQHLFCVLITTEPCFVRRTGVKMDEGGSSETNAACAALSKGCGLPSTWYCLSGGGRMANAESDGGDSKFCAQFGGGLDLTRTALDSAHELTAADETGSLEQIFSADLAFLAAQGRVGYVLALNVEEPFGTRYEKGFFKCRFAQPGVLVSPKTGGGGVASSGARKSECGRRFIL